MMQQQNAVIMKLLKKHDSLCETVTAVHRELNETKAQVSQLADKENCAPVPIKSKNKRTYPSALTVSYYRNVTKFT